MGDSELNNQGMQVVLLLMCRVDDHKATIKLGHMGPLPQFSLQRLSGLLLNPSAALPRLVTPASAALDITFISVSFKSLFLCRGVR